MIAPADTADHVVSELDFPPWTDVADRESVVRALGPAARRSGLYVLGFADGSRYLGRSTDVLRRFDQHRKNHADITQLTFRRVPEADQARLERDFIHTLEHRGVRLRNKAEMSVIEGPSSFDELVSPAEQQRWLESGVHGVDDAVPTRDENLRHRYRRDFERFRALPLAGVVTRVLGRYVQVALPLPRRTELTSWSLSCLPSGGWVVARLNLNMQEVMCVVAEGPSFFVSFHLARKPFEDHFGRRWQRELENRGFEVDMHRYGPGGQNQFNLVTDGEAATFDLLSFDVGTRAIRELNLNLMRKGPSFYRQSHCHDLADAAFRAARLPR